MLRFFSLACLAIFGVSGVLGGAQDRPDLSGRWTLVGDRSTPPGSQGPFGNAFEIAQQSTFIEFDTAVLGFQLSNQGGQLAVGQKTASTFTQGYTTDGAEHETPPPVARPGVTVMVQSKRSYRAVWTTGQLVIVEYHKAAATRGNNVEGQLTSVVRTGFSLDSDGSLLVDRIGVAIPRPNGPKQEPPVPTRSVYKKAQ